MEQEQMMLYGNEFMKCIESIDLQKEDMADVYPELKKRFSRFAQLLHLARSTVTVHVSPNSFEPEGGEHSFTIVYNPDHGPDEYSITVNHYVVLDAQVRPGCGLCLVMFGQRRKNVQYVLCQSSSS